MVLNEDNIGMRTDEVGFGHTMALISGKYKLLILYWLSDCEVIRYNEMRRCIGQISDRTLSRTLKELEKDDLVIRTEFEQIPPKVEYRLSEKGRSFVPILEAMCMWGEAHR